MGMSGFLEFLHLKRKDEPLAPPTSSTTGPRGGSTTTTTPPGTTPTTTPTTIPPRNQRLAALGPNPTPEQRYMAIRTKAGPGGGPLIGTGKAIDRDQLGKTQLEKTNPPPSTQSAESEANALAAAAARRTRRRAQAGSAGKVTTGPGATPGVTAGGTARQLIGY